MSNENNENVYIISHDMFGQEVEEQKNFNLYANNLFMDNSNHNIFDILESIDNFSILANRINEYNIAERAYEEILEEKMMDAAIIESENSYESYERKPECIINIKSLNFKDCKHNDTGCTICITEYTSEDKVSILKCNHIYHNKCIIEWGMYRPECPMCRTSIEVKNVVDYDKEENDIDVIEKEEDTLPIEDKISIIIIETNCSREQAIKTLRDCNEELNVTILKIINGYNSK